MTPPIKILILIASMRTGGKERVVLEILKHLDRSQYEPILAVMNDGELLSQVSDVRVYANLARFRGDILGFSWRLWQAIRQERPDILYCLSYRIPAWVGRSLAKWQGVPLVIYELHGVEQVGQRDLDWLDRHLFDSLTDHMVAIGNAFRQNLLRDGVSPDKITVIPNGIDAQRFRPLAHPEALKHQLLGLGDHELVLGCITNFRPIKNLPMLIDVFALLKPQFPKLHLVIVGDGTERAGLESYIANYQLADIHLLGQRQDIPELMNCFDVFALTSTSEAAPLVILEAMACQVPVVATDVGEVREIIHHNQTGYVVTSQNRSAFAESVGQLLTDANLRTQMGLAGRTRVEDQFTIQKSVQARATLFADLLAKKTACSINAKEAHPHD